jgi:hypothetical protein
MQRVWAGLAALTLAGCLQVDQHLALDADGSGHLTVHYGLREDQLADLAKTARRAETAQPGVPPLPSPGGLLVFTEDELRKEFKAYADLGLELDEVRISSSNGVKWVYLDVRFRDLGGLSGSEFFADSSLALERTPAGHFIFRQDPPLRQVLGGGLEAARGEVDAGLARLLKGFHATLRVTVPGDILSTTAAQRRGRRAEWDFDEARDPQALARARGTALVIEFAGEGLANLKPTAPAAAKSEAARGGG